MKEKNHMVILSGSCSLRDFQFSNPVFGEDRSIYYFVVAPSEACLARIICEII